MMGDAKGAAEPFIRNNMSPENKKQYELVINDFYDNGIVKTIAASRTAKKWTVEQVKKLIDEGPYTSGKAKTLGLIDRIVYYDDIAPTIKKDLSTDNLVLTKNYGKKKTEIDDNPFALLSKLIESSQEEKLQEAEDRGDLRCRRHHFRQERRRFVRRRFDGFGHNDRGDPGRPRRMKPSRRSSCGSIAPADQRSPTI